VLVNSLGIGPPARERMLLAGLVFERVVATAFELAPAEAAYSELTPRVVVAGVRHLVLTKLLERRHRELASHTDEVLHWIEAYRIPEDMRLRTLTLCGPAHMPPTPAAFLTGNDRRARLLGSVVHLTLDEGYAALPIRRSRTSRGSRPRPSTARFENKEECFLTVLDEFVAEMLDCVRPAMDEADSWEQGVCRAMGAFMSHLIAHEALLRIAIHRPVRSRPGE